MAVLTIDEVQTYIQDKLENNHLLTGVEFPDPMVSLAIDLAISEFNTIPPLSSHDITNFPGKALLMSGTLYKLFYGQAALLARNHMSYTDGGVSIPIEERAALYQSLAAMYQADFLNTAKVIKIQNNIDSGWGEVRTDYSNFPIW